MRRRKVSDEVYVAEGGVLQVRAADLEFLKGQACGSPRKRARLCAHPGALDRLHEMLIVLNRECYVRPHRHGGKSESFHVIEGELDVFLFRDDGSVRDVVHMGDHASGKAFFYRLMEDVYHAPVAAGPRVLFHETTNGPFDPDDARPAPWAPDETDAAAAAAYVDALRCVSRAWPMKDPRDPL